MTEVTPASIAYIATQVSRCIVRLCAFLIFRKQYCRSGSRCHPRLFSPAQTPRPIRKASIILLWTYLMTSKRARKSTIFSSGGISRLSRLSLKLTNLPLCNYSQIFPNSSLARRPPCQNSALARIKAKRLEQKTSIA